MIAPANAFLEAVQADGPSADRGRSMDLYGWLIGSWDLDVTEIPETGPRRRRRGEWHFGWVLEGRAIQDVWIVPSRRAGRPGDATANANRYGSTMRIYDPGLDAWHIQWTDPVSQIYLSQIGRRQGEDIAQEGTGTAGRLVRWRFSDITPQSFRWTSELSADDGATWRLNMEFLARRADS